LYMLFAMPASVASAASATIKVGVHQNMNAHLLTPDGPGPYPAILLMHTSGGLQPADMEYAKRLVQEGYVVLIPAFMEAYGIHAKTRQLTFTTHAPAVYADFVASLEFLKHHEKVDGKKLGAIGFSNGGYFALWLAATRQVRAGISYYGALSGAGTDSHLSRFREVFTGTSAPVLVLHGTDDSTVPINIAIRLGALLTAAQSPHELQRYAGAEHRFERDRGASNETAAADAWQRTLGFLGNSLKN
jgi:carboxymethylenebutenolidase